MGEVVGVAVGGEVIVGFFVGFTVGDSVGSKVGALLTVGYEVSILNRVRISVIIASSKTTEPDPSHVPTLRTSRRSSCNTTIHETVSPRHICMHEHAIGVAVAASTPPSTLGQPRRVEQLARWMSGGPCTAAVAAE